MKKYFLLVLVIFLVICMFININFKSAETRKKDVNKFNFEYEYYNNNNLSGLDITTLINKAISNNEKYQVSKDNNGFYSLTDDNSIEIYITMIINNTTYRMESIKKVGIEKFISGFESVRFRCTDVTYHESNGKIASMTFEPTEY